MTKYELAILIILIIVGFGNMIISGLICMNLAKINKKTKYQ
jgi:hypothetical protein